MAFPSSASWMDAWLSVQANTESVSVTRVFAAWAALMTSVMLALVQPAQPVVSDPSLLRFRRFPAPSTPSEK